MMAGLVKLVTGAQAAWLGSDPVDASGEVPQRIYYANHASHLDTPVIWAALPPPVRAVTRPVAARDYWDSDPIRRFISQRWLKVVLVDRSGGASAEQASKPIEAALAAGASLIIYPEGTRNTTPDSGLLPFKSGLYHLARAFPAVACVPVWLANLSRILPKGEKLPVPLIAKVSFGAEIRPETDETKDAFLKRAQDALAALGGEDR